MITVTIEFERMPGLCAPVTLVFEKIGNITYCYYDCGSIYFRDWANCHPRDTFSWEVGIRLAAKRACPPETYRAFRRWMWLKKQEHECMTNCIKQYCPGSVCGLEWRFKDVCAVRILNLPSRVIAREFGRVKVTIS